MLFLTKNITKQTIIFYLGNPPKYGTKNVTFQKYLNLFLPR